MCARTGLWEPLGGNALGPPGHERLGRELLRDLNVTMLEVCCRSSFVIKLKAQTGNSLSLRKLTIPEHGGVRGIELLSTTHDHGFYIDRLDRAGESPGDKLRASR